MKKAILVGINRYKGNKLKIYMDELAALADTLNIETTARFTQDITQATAPYRIGRGKVEEISTHIQNNPVDLVLFNDELTSSQIRNLEEIFNIPVVDRTLLILDIFSKRAKTKEAMLQVEVAHLKYLLPRLKSMTASFERQQGGIGSRGPGEKKIELSRRKIESDIVRKEKQLKHIVTIRQTNRRYRQKSPIKTVAIVGYTNAGKSTLMNTLLASSKTTDDHTVNVKDQLFATLETTSRRIELNNSKPFILTDTIGFISNLPHDLIDSFKSTLEEIKEADLLLHVIDFSNPDYLEQITTTQSVLKQLDADHIETLYVFNKIDLTEETLPHGFSPAVKVSLKNQKNIDSLIDSLTNLLSQNDKTITYKIPYSAGEVINVLNEHSHIIETTHDNDGTIIKARVSSAIRHNYKQYEI